MKLTMIAISIGLALPISSLLAKPIAKNAPEKTAYSSQAQAALHQYVVLLKDEPIATYQGNIKGLEATSPEYLKQQKGPLSPEILRGKVDFSAPSVQAYTAYLESKQTQALNSIATALGKEVTPTYQLKSALNGFLFELTTKDADKLASLPFVKHVELQKLVPLDTAESSEIINADAIWDSTATGVSARGEGIIVGIIDSGVRQTHNAFKQQSSTDSYTHQNPKGDGVYFGRCETTPSYCNSKLIGMYDYTSEKLYVDESGHGSHVAGTASGNPLDVGATTITGIAPRANIISYDICIEEGCGNGYMGAEQAIINGIDVINYSISGHDSSPWSSVTSLAFKSANAAGIFVATSAGNDGTAGASSIAEEKSAPWLTTVGSTTKAEIMSGFSSKGPSTIVDVMTPTLIAPGSSIIAPTQEGDSATGAKSGTSMASPHVAGAAALMKQLYPTWSNAEIKSALATTGKHQIETFSGSSFEDIFSTGGGRIDVAAAANTGLVLDETDANYTSANPEQGGNPKDLNLPSMASRTCYSTCSWTRTVKAVKSGTWNVSVETKERNTVEVSPQSFTLAQGESQELNITANVTGAHDDWEFNSVTLTPTDGLISTNRLPIGAKSQATLGLPATTVIETNESNGSYQFKDIQVNSTGDLFIKGGFADSTTESFSLLEDATNSDPYDDAAQVHVSIIEVPRRTEKLYINTYNSESPDLDLFVGRDLNGDSIPQESELIAYDADPDADETVEISLPVNGTWWVLVQNYRASSEGASDTFSLDVVTSKRVTSSDFTFDYPTPVEPNTAFDLTVNWTGLDTPDTVHFATLEISSNDTYEADYGTYNLKIIRNDEPAELSANFASSINYKTVSFTNQTSGGASGYTYAWDFGDGTLSTEESPTHTYAISGAYTVSLIATDSENSTSSYSTTITIADALQASIETIQNNESVTVNASSTGGSGNVSYTWNFGDGATGSGASASHTYTESGTYTITLNAESSGDSQSATVTDSVEIYISPSASFTSSVSDLTATFNNTSTGGSGSISYAWDFGDNGTSTSTSPSHTYAEAGTYTVTLAMTDGENNTSTLSRSVTVTEPKKSGGGGGGSMNLGLLMLLLTAGLIRRRK
jgi:PKD repeat protein/subtilisin family serine protease